MKTPLFEKLLWIFIVIQCTIVTTVLSVEYQNQDGQQNVQFPINQELEPPYAIGSYRNARDSYGNPLNGNVGIKGGNKKKVVEVDGYLFEIPSYASGITEVKVPTTELLPPLTNEERPPPPADYHVNELNLDLLPPFQSKTNNNLPTGSHEESSNEILGTDRPTTNYTSTQESVKSTQVGTTETDQLEGRTESSNNNDYTTESDEVSEVTNTGNEEETTVENRIGALTNKISSTTPTHTEFETQSNIDIITDINTSPESDYSTKEVTSVETTTPMPILTFESKNVSSPTSNYSPTSKVDITTPSSDDIHTSTPTTSTNSRFNERLPRLSTELLPPVENDSTYATTTESSTITSKTAITESKLYTVSRILRTNPVMQSFTSESPKLETIETRFNLESDSRYNNNPISENPNENPRKDNNPESSKCGGSDPSCSFDGVGIKHQNSPNSAACSPGVKCKTPSNVDGAVNLQPSPYNDSYLDSPKCGDSDPLCNFSGVNNSRQNLPNLATCPPGFQCNSPTNHQPSPSNKSNNSELSNPATCPPRAQCNSPLNNNDDVSSKPNSSKKGNNPEPPNLASCPPGVECNNPSINNGALSPPPNPSNQNKNPDSTNPSSNSDAIEINSNNPRLPLQGMLPNNPPLDCSKCNQFTQPPLLPGYPSRILFVLRPEFVHRIEFSPSTQYRISLKCNSRGVCTEITQNPESVFMPAALVPKPNIQRLQPNLFHFQPNKQQITPIQNNRAPTAQIENSPQVKRPVVTNSNGCDNQNGCVKQQNSGPQGINFKQQLGGPTPTRILIPVKLSNIEPNNQNYTHLNEFIFNPQNFQNPTNRFSQCSPQQGCSKPNEFLFKISSQNIASPSQTESPQKITEHIYASYPQTNQNSNSKECDTNQNCKTQTPSNKQDNLLPLSFGAAQFPVPQSNFPIKFSLNSGFLNNFDERIQPFDPIFQLNYPTGQSSTTESHDNVKSPGEPTIQNKFEDSQPVSNPNFGFQQKFPTGSQDEKKSSGEQLSPTLGNEFGTPEPVSKLGFGFQDNYSTVSFSSAQDNKKNPGEKLPPPLENKFGTPFKPTFQFSGTVTSPSLPAVNEDTSKYTGGFGGAPGILGNQNKPGFAIQPDGSIKDPDHQYRPGDQNAITPTIPFATIQSTTPTVHLTPLNNNKYTGSFGGPPGILSPYDNTRV